MGLRKTDRMFRLITMFHVVFAGFFLPAAVTFAITGGLYTFGIRGSYSTRSLTKELQLTADPTLDQVHTVARQLIAEEFKASEPSGQPGLRKVGTSWSFDWSGTRADFSLEPTATPNQYKVAYKETSLHRFFVQLHKAKGGGLFKLLAGALAIGFLLLFASGVALAYMNPRLKKVMYSSLMLGLIVYSLAAWLS